VDRGARLEAQTKVAKRPTEHVTLAVDIEVVRRSPCPKHPYAQDFVPATTTECVVKYPTLQRETDTSVSSVNTAMIAVMLARNNV